MNGIGQQQGNRFAAPGTSGPPTSASQYSMFVTPGFHGGNVQDNFNHSHTKPNGRPTFIMPQISSNASGNRFMTPTAPQIIRNGGPYPSNAIIQQRLVQTSQTIVPNQGSEMNVSGMFGSQQIPDTTAMEFNTSSLYYQSLAQNAQMFQQPETMSMVRSSMVAPVYRFPPQGQFYIVQSPGSVIPPTVMMLNPQQQALQQQMQLQQQQQQQQQQQLQQQFDSRHDASTPQSQHSSFMPPHFMPEHGPFYYHQPQTHLGNQQATSTQLAHQQQQQQQQHQQQQVQNQHIQHMQQQYIHQQHQQQQHLHQQQAQQLMPVSQQQQQHIQISQQLSQQQQHLQQPHAPEALQAQYTFRQSVTPTCVMSTAPIDAINHRFPRPASRNPIMYLDEYVAMSGQAQQQSTLGRKEKKTIKIINPNTNQEINLRAPSLAVEEFQTKVHKKVYQADEQTNTQQQHATTTTSQQQQQNLQQPIYTFQQQQYHTPVTLTQVQQKDIPSTMASLLTMTTTMYGLTPTTTFARGIVARNELETQDSTLATTTTTATVIIATTTMTTARTLNAMSTAVDVPPDVNASTATSLDSLATEAKREYPEENQAERKNESKVDSDLEDWDNLEEVVVPANKDDERLTETDRTLSEMKVDDMTIVEEAHKVDTLEMQDGNQQNALKDIHDIDEEQRANSSRVVNDEEEEEEDDDSKTSPMQDAHSHKDDDTQRQPHLSTNDDDEDDDDDFTDAPEVGENDDDDNDTNDEDYYDKDKATEDYKDAVVTSSPTQQNEKEDVATDVTEPRAEAVIEDADEEEDDDDLLGKPVEVTVPSSDDQDLTTTSNEPNELSETTSPSSPSQTTSVTTTSEATTTSSTETTSPTSSQLTSSITGSEDGVTCNDLTGGKRVYSRDFLMGLRDHPESQKKLPLLSPDLTDIIRTSPLRRDSSLGNISGSSSSLLMLMGGIRGMPQMGMFVPDYNQTIFGKSGSQPNRPANRSSQKRDYQQGSQQRIINVQLSSDVQLHTTEQAWKPSMKASGDEYNENAVTENLYKKVRSILNKLTPQNFEALLKQIHELEINTEDKLSGCIKIVFEKAISEPNFCEAYAKMACNISTLKVPCKDNPHEALSFRRLLLNRCQTEFEKDRSDEIELEKRQKEIEECQQDDKRKQLILEKEEMVTKARRRSLGNIRFIGELFKMKMLTEKIMFECLTKLIKATDEDSIECLCWLLRTIGKDLDSDRNKKHLDAFFSEIVKKSKSKGVSPRTKFMLQDIIELRSNIWVPRRNEFNPKTIAQIHKEAQQEELQKQAMINQSPLLINNYQPPSLQQQPTQMMTKIGTDPSMAMHGMRGRAFNQGVGGSGRMQMVEDGGWTTFNNNRGGARVLNEKVPLDHSKLMFSRQNEGEIKLGPCKVATWTSGAAATGIGLSSSRQSSQESEKTNASNRLAGSTVGGDSYDSRLGRPPPTGRRESTGMTFRSQNPFPRPDHYSTLPSSKSRYDNRPSPANSLSRDASRESSLSREQMNRASPVLNFHPYHQHSALVNKPQPSSSPSLSSLAAPSMPPAPPPPVKEASNHLTDEIFNQKSKGILDEYLYIKDKKEALLSVQDMRLDSRSSATFVYTIITHALEKSTDECNLTGELLGHLNTSSVLQFSSIKNGLEQALSDAPDLEIDIPRIWTCYSDLISSMLLQSYDLLPHVAEVVELKLKMNNRAGPLMAESISKVTKKQANNKIITAWNERELSWCRLTDQPLYEFTVQNKLESLDVISSELLLLMRRNSAHSVFFSWIKKHIEPNQYTPLFIRSLTNAICIYSLHVSGKEYNIRVENFKEQAYLLRRYIDINKEDRSKDNSELQALYAVQAFVCSLEHPPNLINAYFQALYDLDLISEDAFLEWRSSTDPQEQTGRGVAITSLRPFFEWLQAPEEENS